MFRCSDALHKQDDAAIAAVLANAKAPLEHMQLFAECAPGIYSLALWLRCFERVQTNQCSTHR